ncbi:hypothetical protein Q4489_18020 [Thalassotalea sp. 1_MG-2023]|uniref:hypothetical protein n=1 Tax=Thalassotalea sp. 1_MG-2023 TaxID=3062680 RepID=UPI0026E13FBF|nr:hypothetical protein [Thalassotalea sp. 1_MG-2023]MDO6428900.1 hypothetical protein [Thalassotalea sp. 1_MG-2023]
MIQSLTTELKTQIIECFKDKTPESIIVGGSHSCAEGNIFISRQKEYWLSDIDLLCVHPDGFSIEEANKIFNNMLTLSNSINQSNPYFHIGLKLRSPSELLQEAKTLYFKELSQNSFSILGKNYLDYFQPQQKFGFDRNDAELQNTLYKCALTRLWCNVLFFPSRLLSSESPDFRVWYNYFYCRGAMDWITWRLIKENMWVNGYQCRFDEWSGLGHSKAIPKEELYRCLQTKLGINNIDYRTVIEQVLEFAISEIEQISPIQLEHYDPEFQFIISMNKYLLNKSLNKPAEYTRINILDSIEHFSQFGELPETEMSDIKIWNLLRAKYSDFRFARSDKDKFDHNVYTEHFLRLGASPCLN